MNISGRGKETVSYEEAHSEEQVKDCHYTSFFTITHRLRVGFSPTAFETSLIKFSENNIPHPRKKRLPPNKFQKTFWCTNNSHSMSVLLFH